jgi:predicted ATPase
MTYHILTGAPGAGKTVLLRGLERAGLAVVEEAATDVIAWAQAEGRDAPWEDAGFIDDILALQGLRERRAPAEGRVVFDRSPVCTLALSRFQGRAPTPRLEAEIERIMAARTYERRVFFVEGLDFITATPARRIDLDGAKAFARVHEEVYQELGFELVRIPPGPAPGRVAKVLEQLPG